MTQQALLVLAANATPDVVRAHLVNHCPCFLDDPVLGRIGVEMSDGTAVVFPEPYVAAASEDSELLQLQKRLGDGCQFYVVEATSDSTLANILRNLGRAFSPALISGPGGLLELSDFILELDHEGPDLRRKL